MIPLLLDLLFDPLVHCLHGVFAILYPSHNAAIRKLKRQLTVALCLFFASLITLIIATYLHGISMLVLIALASTVIICFIVGWLASRLDEEVLAHQKSSHPNNPLTP